MELEQPTKRFRPTIKPDLDLLARVSAQSKGSQDQKISHNPDVYTPVEQRFNITSKSFDVIPCELRNKEDGKLRFLSKLDPNTLLNNLVIVIPNPNNLQLNDLVQSIEITNGGCQMYRINGDIETHISVLGHFLNSSWAYNPTTMCTEISLGLIHSAGLIAKYEWHDLVFELETTTPYPINIIFKANLYTAKEFDGTDTWVSSDPTDTNIFCDQRKFRKFLLHGIDSASGCIVNKRETMPFNHPVSVIYLTSIDPNIVSHVCLRVNGAPIINMSKDELYQINKYYYSIDSNQIILIYNQNILTSNDLSINFSRIDRVDLEVQTNQLDQSMQPTSFTVNVLNTNVIGINTNCLSWTLFTN